jgi:hypothetical protein
VRTAATGRNRTRDAKKSILLARKPSHRNGIVSERILTNRGEWSLQNAALNCTRLTWRASNARPCSCA